MVITEMWVVMALAAVGTALTNNLRNLMITTPPLILITIIMILIDIMRVRIREADSNKDMALEMKKFIPKNIFHFYPNLHYK